MPFWLAVILMSLQPTSDPATELARRPPCKVAAGMTVVQQWQIHEPVAPGRLADRAYETARKLGITSVQSYVGWAQLEPEPGRVTYALYDPVVSQLRKHRLKWLPFLITAPYIATPGWFREKSGVSATCLEHGKPTPIQSIWNPSLRTGVRRFLTLFRQHSAANDIEALNLGISGNWGESIMPVGGGFNMDGQHTHVGWWCGDPYARASFRRWLQRRYRTVLALNRAWRASYTGFDTIEPFIRFTVPSRHANKELVDWYTGSMTAYAEFWVRTARELYPTLPIYLCTGGDGNPILGADFAAQARMCARYHAGIRITNEGDNALDNFAITHMVSSATRLYGGYYTTEPGGDNSVDGIAGRVFDATAGGARGAYFKYLMDEPDLPTEKGLRFMDNAQYLVPNRPKLTVAVLMPNASIALDPGLLATFLDRAAYLRDAADFEFLDENMIADGMLRRFRCVCLLAGDTLEARTIARLRAWVQGGGVLIAGHDSLPLRTVEGQPATWLSAGANGERAVRVVWSSYRPDGLAIDLGRADAEFLKGSWHGAEGRSTAPTAANPHPSFRWTTGDSRLILPLPRKGPYILRALLTVPGQVGDRASITVNGSEAIRLQPGGSRWVELAIPAANLAGASTVEVAFHSPTWVPGPNDPRALGIQVYRVELGTRDGRYEAGEEIIRKLRVTDTALRDAATKFGKGYVVAWPDGWTTYAPLLSAAIHADRAPWPRIAEPIDAAFDGVVASRVGDSVYYLNNTAAPVKRRLANGRTQTIPAYHIVAVPTKRR